MGKGLWMLEIAPFYSQAPVHPHMEFVSLCTVSTSFSREEGKRYGKDQRNTIAGSWSPA